MSAECANCLAPAVTDGGCPFCIYVVRDSIRGCTALTGPGDPRWSGPPDQLRIRRILELTTSDSRGRRYFKFGGQWRRLVTPADFEQLNKVVV